MKILAIATLVVFLSCLEVALSYSHDLAPKPRYPKANLQERAPFRMAGRPRGISRSYLSDANTQQEESMFS